jgi:hypothetical protein
MGAIAPSKMPKKKVIHRTDDPNNVDMYADGGQVWDTPNPNKKSKELSSIKKDAAKSRARKAGRPYPNLIDNMWAARDK